MANTKTNAQIVFAEFPEWKKLTEADQNSLYEQLERLWKSQERNKAIQVFDYLYDNEYDIEKLNLFVENSDADFQYHYVEKLLAGCFRAAGKFSLAREWLKKVQQNDAECKYKYADPDDVYFIPELRHFSMDISIPVFFYPCVNGLFFRSFSLLLEVSLIARYQD